jgi:hypothetical protein
MDDIFVNHLKVSIQNADNCISKITPEILELEGMSGKCTRHFYNNLCSMPDARYLEIGTWKGSTFCSAMMNNSATMLAIDNWSQWGDNGSTRNAFIENVNKFNKDNKVAFIEKDCWKINPTTLPKMNVYVYDGDHDYDDQYNALAYYIPCLDDVFIFVVDDWNAPHPRNGTRDAIRDLKLDVLYEVERLTSTDGSHPAWGSPEQAAWHNGMYAAVLRKPRN